MTAVLDFGYLHQSLEIHEIHVVWFTAITAIIAITAKYREIGNREILVGLV